jgi:hypothetical protein
MKKVLVYNLYAKDIITDNKCYAIHQKCIEYYKDIFDNMIFYLSVDDLSNVELVRNMSEWVTQTCIGKNYEIKIRQNTKLCESKIFKEEIIDKRELYKDTFIFFGHAKNATRLDKNLNVDGDDFTVNVDSIIKWSIALYFYGLNFQDELDNRLLGYPRQSEMFYGPLLTQLNDPSKSSILRMNKGNCHYQGTFYWINMNAFNNYINRNIIELPLIDNRYWVEMLPGVVGGRYKYGDGCSSHYDVAITDDFNLYKLDEDNWIYLANILGDGNEFWEFYNRIMREVID